MSSFRKKISNNNQQAVKILAKAYLKANRGRNGVLIGTVALSILVLCTVFGIALGKIDAEYLQSIRSTGTAASTYLEQGSMEQYEAIRKLSYIQEVGREKSAGELYVGETFVAGVRCLDETGWEKLTRPAYTHIHGHYPEEKGEIMLSKRALESLGIREPQLGMELSLTMQHGLFDKEEVSFHLCGWYRDYMSPSVYPPIAYVSEAQLKVWDMSLEEPHWYCCASIF